MPSNFWNTATITLGSATTTTTYSTVKLINTLWYQDKEPKDINEFLRMALIDKSIKLVYSYV